MLCFSLRLLTRSHARSDVRAGDGDEAEPSPTLLEAPAASPAASKELPKPSCLTLREAELEEQLTQVTAQLSQRHAEFTAQAVQLSRWDDQVAALTAQLSQRDEQVAALIDEASTAPAATPLSSARRLPAADDVGSGRESPRARHSSHLDVDLLKKREGKSGHATDLRKNSLFDLVDADGSGAINRKEFGDIYDVRGLPIEPARSAAAPLRSLARVASTLDAAVHEGRG